MSTEEYALFRENVKNCQNDLVFMQHLGQPNSRGDWHSFGDRWGRELARHIPQAIFDDPIISAGFTSRGLIEFDRIAAVGLGAKYAHNARQFKILTGLNDKHGGSKTFTLRGALVHGYWDSRNGEPAKGGVISLSELRRAATMLYHVLRPVIDEIPYPVSLREMLRPE